MLELRQAQVASLSAECNRELLEWCIEQLQGRSDPALEPAAGWSRWVRECIEQCYRQGIDDSESIYLYLLDRLDEHASLAPPAGP